MLDAVGVAAEQRTPTKAVERAHPILRLVVQRLAFGVVVVLTITLLVFSLIHIAPGTPESRIAAASGYGATPERVAQLREQYDLGAPLPAQYLRFLENAAQLDFGESLVSNEEVLPVIAEKFTTVTGPLVVLALLVAAVGGVSLGVVAAYRRGRPTDRAANAIGIVGSSAPPFAAGIILLYVFAYRLGWFPLLGAGEGFADRVWHLVLPATTLGIFGLAAILKFTRAAVIRSLEGTNVTFAKARGISEVQILWSQVLRNSMIGIVTIISLTFVSFLSATALIEEVFNLPGVGAALIRAIDQQDLPVIQAITLMFGVIVVIVNLIADLLNMALDPRIRVRGEGL